MTFLLKELGEGLHLLLPLPDLFPGFPLLTFLYDKLSDTPLTLKSE